MARGGNRLKYQVEQSLKHLNFIGQSKRAFRQADQETGIHSTTQMKHALSVSQNFGAWLKGEKKVKDLFQLKRAHYREYLEFMKNKNVSNGHLINIETNLRLLEKGMQRVSSQKGMKTRDWVPKQRLIDVNSREQAKDRSLSETAFEKVRSEASTNTKDAMDLQMAFGLRLREAANSKMSHIVERDGTFYWEAVSDKGASNTAIGVTKGGRARKTPVLPKYESFVRDLIKGKGSDEFLLKTRYNTLKSAYNRMGVKGSHSFRHTYARTKLLDSLKQKGIEKQGRDMIGRMLENRAAGYRKDHLVTKEERSLYRQVNGVVDDVHAALGHGKGRIDLCAVYMQGV